MLFCLSLSVLLKHFSMRLFQPIILLLAILPTVVTVGQNYDFKDKIRLKTTDVEDQGRSGTCWCFSTTSFIEAEMMRKGLEPVNLSEMFIVYNCYVEKANQYVREEGKTNITAGGLFHDVTWAASQFGLAPESVYKGIKYNSAGHNHSELDTVAVAFLKTICSQKKLSNVWPNAFRGILNAYLGIKPQTFDYNGKKHTPKTFASEVVQFEPSDYVMLTSFTHHPFYTQFILEDRKSVV